MHTWLPLLFQRNVAWTARHHIAYALHDRLTVHNLLLVFLENGDSLALLSLTFCFLDLKVSLARYEEKIVEVIVIAGGAALCTFCFSHAFWYFGNDLLLSFFNNRALNLLQEHGHFNRHSWLGGGRFFGALDRLLVFELRLALLALNG